MPFLILLGAEIGAAQTELSLEPTAPAAAASPARTTTKNAKFSLPLSFDPSESGVQLPPPEIEYELADGGKSLRIGNVLLNDKTFVFVLRPLGALNKKLVEVTDQDIGSPVLALVWPDPLLKSGSLEMISRTGQVLWRHEITAKNVEAWRAKLDGWKKAMKAKGVPEAGLKGGLFATRYAIEDLKGKGAPFFAGRLESFRFCLTQQEGKAQSRLCSERFASVVKGAKIIMGKVASSATPRVVVQNENGALAASVPVAADSPAQFYADLAGGQSYEFLATPTKLNLVDITDTKKEGLIRVSGHGTPPAGPHILLNPDRTNQFVSFIGFEPTIGDSRKFWAAGFDVSDPKLYFPGVGGGVFKQKFDLNEIPRSAARPHFDKTTPKGTYSSEPALRGRKLPDSQVTSDQSSVTVDPKDPTLFVWNFRAKEKGELNRSYLSVNYLGKTYKGFFEIYRAHANELSGRFSAVAGSGSLVFMGEVAYNVWFETLAGWENYYLGKQRWGASAKYFKSLTQLSVSETEKASLDVLAVDLKYRLTPGMWTRDETLGAMLSYQSVTFGSLKAPMLGVGAFWARSMPRVFDNLFNYLPFMEYPKWVDMEFIYYVSSMNANVALNNTMALNFHGQVLWTKSFFGEAGFGYKRYGFTDKSLNVAAKLDTFYGTVGLGLKF